MDIFGGHSSVYHISTVSGIYQGLHLMTMHFNERKSKECCPLTVHELEAGDPAAALLCCWLEVTLRVTLSVCWADSLMVWNNKSNSGLALVFQLNRVLSSGCTLESLRDFLF